MRAATLFGDLDIRGLSSEGMNEAFAERLGRALGTLVRRRGAAEGGFVVGRDAGEALARLRDGLVRGLVLSGQHVVDIGVSSARTHEFALIHLARPAGVFVTGDAEPGGAAGFEVLLGGGPLVGDGIGELRELTLAGDFSAGLGALELYDIEPALQSAQRQGDVPGFGRDTQVL